MTAFLRARNDLQAEVVGALYDLQPPETQFPHKRNRFEDLGDSPPRRESRTTRSPLMRWPIAATAR
jgi:hypothetical protein